MNKNIPNILTISRFAFIPLIIIFLIKDIYLLAFIMLTLSALTDVLDGFLARKFNLITDFGKLMDPLADKATQLSLLTTLFLKGMLPVWILIIVVIKEFCMVSGASFLYGKELVVSSKWYGKLATVLFYLALVMSLCIKNIENVTNKELTTVTTINHGIYYLAVATTIASLIMYMKAFYVQGYLKKKSE